MGARLHPIIPIKGETVMGIKHKMEKGLKKIIRFAGPATLLSLVLLGMVEMVHAQGSLGGNWSQFLDDTGLKTFSTPGTVEGEAVAVLVVMRAIRMVRYGVGGVALIFGILYASALVFSKGNEEVLTKQKKNFLWAFMGFVILMVGEQISRIFNPMAATSESLIDFTVARDQLRAIADYVKWMVGSVIVLLMTISGIKMVIASGDEEKITTQKRNLVWSVIGMLVVLLASNIINAIYVINTGTVAALDAPTGATATLGNVLRLMLVVMGPAAVLFTIYAGFLYLTALEDEEQTKKAKSMIIGGITGIVIIYSAYALVNTFFVTSLATISN